MEWKEYIGDEARRKAKEKVRDALGHHSIQASFIGFDRNNHVTFKVDPKDIDEARKLLRDDVPPKNIQPTHITRRG